MKLEGKGILITGGSRGLGRALGDLAAARGARVGLVARNPGPLAEAVEAIRAAGGDAHALVADVADKRAIHPLAARAVEALGEVSVLINAASTLGPTPLRSLMDTECEDLGRVLETNLVGPFRLSRALLGPMLLRGEGVVVQVSSDAGVEAYPTWGAYGASKAALDHLTRIWASELDGTGVHMLSVDPGEMNTRMHAEAMPDADPGSLADPRDIASRLLALIEAPAGALRVELGVDGKEVA